VENPRPGGGPLTVYAVPTAGPRRLAGTVVAAQSTRLNFNVVTTGQYRLVAETAGRTQLTSNLVTVGPGDTIWWDLTANIATVGRE
jgi:hypothetical protein